jgi:multiple RNA-binding domain-containing protein 1
MLLLTHHQVRLVRDGVGDSRGIGYVQFADSESAEHALKELGRKSFQGRLLHVEKTAHRTNQKLNEYQISQLPLKKRKALRRKTEAAGSTFNWNSMYMNPNAVLESVADRLGVTKADLIDPSSADAAVKQAHAETHVIQETKAYLLSNGVDLDAFRQRQRDDAVLLVKNFPYGTTAEELKILLRPYGEIKRLLLPSSGTTAIVQFSQPTEGIQAIRNLAYRNFKGTLLYLEKGPKGLFTRRHQGEADQSPANKSTTVDQGTEAPGKAEESPSSTVFIRNLNFITTSSGLTNAFSPLHGFLSAKVKTRVDSKRPREVLSMGFGFVEFGDSQQALAAVSAMNGYRLDNHELLVQISRRATDVAEEQRRKDNQRKGEAHKTKLIIKNVPFEATKRDIRSLLGAYGQLRSLKLPQKFDHTTRGFAFADFVTAKEAENAMEALKDTHLLGRRLVLEFADEESIDPEDELRAMESKVGKQTEMIHLKQMTDSGRNRFKVGTEDPLQY